MNRQLLRQVCLTLIVLISPGHCLQCYKCFDTNKACFYGYTNSLGILNCSTNEVCAVFQYETDDSNTVYTTTVRGCQQLIKDGICQQLMKTIPSKGNKNTVQRGVHCETCDENLCNYSPVFSSCSLVVPIIMAGIILKYFM